VRARLELSGSERDELLQRPTLTIPETAAVLGVGPSALRDAQRRGQINLPILQIGRRRVVPTIALRRILGLDS
jgi:predicted site-specific integrase-resolvase